MTNIHETAYPILPAEPERGRTESVVYTDHGRDALRAQTVEAGIDGGADLLLQRLGYFPMLSDVPHIIIDHLRAAFRIRSLPRTRISRYDRSGTRARHQKLLRAYVDIRQLDAGAAVAQDQGTAGKWASG
jgi:hypothetical protein